MSSILRVPRELVKCFAAPKRIFSQNFFANKKSAGFNLRRLAFNLSGYNKYGLYSDDVIDYEDSMINEALRRLPREVLDARNFRIIRAMQLDFLKIYLPKEKWITYEEDLEYRYLLPYIKEIEAEKMEIYEFGCVNYSDHDWPSDEIK